MNNYTVSVALADFVMALFGITLPADVHLPISFSPFGYFGKQG